MSDDSNDWVEVGFVARPHGVRGEVRVKLHNPTSETLFDVDEVSIQLGDCAPRIMRIRSARPAADGIVLLSLDGVGDRDQAEALRSARLHVPRDVLPPVEDGEFYVHDILGAQVVGGDGTVFGRVVDYVSYPAVDVIVVQGDRRYEVPVIDDFVHRIDAGAKQVIVGAIEDFETT